MDMLVRWRESWKCGGPGISISWYPNAHGVQWMDGEVSNRRLIYYGNFRREIFEVENFGGWSTWFSHEYQRIQLGEIANPLIHWLRDHRVNIRKGHVGGRTWRWSHTLKKDWSAHETRKRSIHYGRDFSITLFCQSILKTGNRSLPRWIFSGLVLQWILSDFLYYLLSLASSQFS